jgi:uncharacterized membrane protein
MSDDGYNRRQVKGDQNMKFVTAYGATLVAVVVFDLIWLGAVAKQFYRTQLAGLIAEPFNLWAASAFYLVYPLGIVVFAVAPAISSGSSTDAVVFGGMFGFFAYATYDLTNLATLREWPVRLTFVDLAWGTILTAVAATCGQLITRSIWS